MPLMSPRVPPFDHRTIGISSTRVPNGGAVAKKPKKKKPRIDFTEIRHDGRTLALPILAAPVGQETPALKLKYPSMNQPKDVEIGDYYLSAIEAVKSLTPSQTPTSEMAMQRLLGIVQRN